MTERETPDVDRESTLAAAYEARNKQLHETRAALAEAVSTLRTELDHRRAEAAALRDERDRAINDNRRAQQLIAEQERALKEMASVLAQFQNMKVVRWSRPLRRRVYRIRQRRR
jgi:hypothetical protein